MILLFQWGWGSERLKSSTGVAPLRYRFWTMRLNALPGWMAELAREGPLEYPAWEGS